MRDERVPGAVPFIRTTRSRPPAISSGRLFSYPASRFSRALRRPTVLAPRPGASRQPASESDSRRPSPQLLPRECDSAAANDAVTALPRMRSRGAHRAGLAQWQRRDDGLRGAALLFLRIRIDPLVRSGGRRLRSSAAGRVRASTVACSGLTPDPVPAIQAGTGSRVVARPVWRCRTNIKCTCSTAGETGWPVAGSATAALPSCLPTAQRRAKRSSQKRCPRRVARPGRLCSLNRRSARFTGTSRAGATGLEPATSGVTGRRSNQLSYAPGGEFTVSQAPPGLAGRLRGPAGRNFRAAREFVPLNRSPEDVPNPAVGALLGSATGTLRGPRRP